jgi:hypothetical protein
MNIELRRHVIALLHDAAIVYEGTPWQARFARAARDVDGPLRVALAGRVKAGKSTLLNALVGEAIAATDAGECTRIVTEYAGGAPEAAEGVLDPGEAAAPNDFTRDGAPGGEILPLRLVRSPAGLSVDLAPAGDQRLRRLLVTVDREQLRRMTLIDTPGLASLSRELGIESRRFLIGEAADALAPDAVLYLIRQVHTTDTNFLQAFRDPAAQRVPPVNAIGVLSRTDEIGGGRADALRLADDLAGIYAQQAQLRPFVQTVLPVSGLLAEAGVRLTEQEFQDVRRLAALAPAVTDAMLLSVDRFTAHRRFLPVETSPRRELLARLGLFGLRWSLEAVRSGAVADVTGLRAGLTTASGIVHLRRVLETQIVGRRDVIKAEAALQLVQRAAAAEECRGARRLAGMAERMRLGVHEFQEVRLLNDLRQGHVDVEDELRQRMERALGASGGGVMARLGLDENAQPAELEHVLLTEHGRWRELATDPAVAPGLRRAGATIQRSLEGMRRDVVVRK